MTRVFILLLGLLASADDSSATKLVGYWYGDNYQPYVHTYVQEFSHHSADGSFVVEFRKYLDCKLIYRDVEAGSWSVSNDIVHMVTLGINGRVVDPAKDPSLIDDYQILVLDDHDYQSKHLATGEIFKLWRVAEHFEFPKCDFTS